MAGNGTAHAVEFSGALLAVFTVIVKGCTEILYIESLHNGAGYILVVFRSLEEGREAA
jgi:hypothetical protein